MVIDHRYIKAMKLLALLLGLTLLGPLHAAQIVAEPFPPAHFTSLYLVKDTRGTITVISLKGDDVTYQVTTAGKVTENITVKPSPDDWFKFIMGLNNAKVYKWAPKYYYPGQGPSWVIDLVMEDRKFGSEGTNEYPKEGAEAEPNENPASGPSVPFQLFWQAALELVGKAPPPAKVGQAGG
jgi:hypothetical protein